MKRPLSLTIVSWFFIAAGSVGFFYHLTEVNVQKPLSNNAPWVLFIRLLAIVAGLLMLWRRDSGRWLLVAWMTYHVVLSYFHDLSQLLIHLILFAAVGIILFRPGVGRFLKSTKGTSLKEP